MADPVVMTDEIESESGAHKALRAERKLRKDAERQVATLRNDLTARVERLEARGLAPFLEALAGMRRDHAAEQAKFHQQIRMELEELGAQIEQLAAMLKAEP